MSTMLKSIYQIYDQELLELLLFVMNLYIPYTMQWSQ